MNRVRLTPYGWLAVFLVLLSVASYYAIQAARADQKFYEGRR